MYDGTKESLIGHRLGPYVVQRRIGRGGMGEVYLAHDTALDRPVALKTLNTAYANDPEFVHRFRREAQAAARLNHPNIVQVHSVDIDSEPPYMVMEYIDSPSVDQLIRDGGPMPWDRVLNICGQVASALACAHAQGIIHRDMKPGNILLDKMNRVRVTDFGLAKLMASTTQLTAADSALGTPAYMSPEQCGVGEVVPASDLFSLGLTAFEMLAGHIPYVAPSAAGVARKIVDDPLPALADSVDGLPAVVQEFLEGLTAKDPSSRYPSAAHVVEDLRALRAGDAPKHLSTLTGFRAMESQRLAAAPKAPGLVAGQASQPSRTSLVDDLLDDEGSPFSKPIPKAPLEIPWGTIVKAAIAVVVLSLAAWAILEFSRRPPPTRRDTANETAAPVETPDAVLNPAQPAFVPGPEGYPPPGTANTGQPGAYPPPHPHPPPGTPGGPGGAGYGPPRHPPGQLPPPPQRQPTSRRR